MALPSVATTKLKSIYYAPEFRFTMQHTLSQKISLAYNLGAEWSSETLEPTLIYTITSGISLTEKLGMYVEFFGDAPKAEKSNHQFDCGVTYNLKPNLLLDISAGKGITENAPKHYISLGFSARFPN